MSVVAQPVHPQLGSPVKVYEYQRASGDAGFVVCRFDPKDFRPAQEKNGRWVWNLEGAPVLPYRLPDLDRALRENEVVWITDGEKDADAIADAGATATCCARSQGWTLELAEQLTGARRVMIVADRDGGTGRRQALEVKDLLVRAGALASVDVEVVEAAEGKDAHDHLSSGRELREFVHVPDDDPTAEDELPRWKPLTAREFLTLPEQQGASLLGPLVLRGGRTIVGGDSGHGKTTLTFAMLAAIVMGTELLGYVGAQLGPALIIDLEQGVRSIKRGITYAGLAATDTHVLNLPDGLALDQSPTELALLEQVIAELRPVVIALDPYYKAHRGDANEERAVTDLMRNLDRLRSEHEFALLLPAHVRKEAQNAGVRKLTLADIAGSGAISRGAEVVLGLERLSHGQARLRYLKDREGDLPVGDALDLEYSQEDGFTIKEKPTQLSIEDAILAVEASGWLTAGEWAKELGFRESETRTVLRRLSEAGKIAYMVGPPGRGRTAKCFSTEVIPFDGLSRAELGSPRDDSEGQPLIPPPSVGGVGEAEFGVPENGQPGLSDDDLFGDA